jgi:hypothetical protein
VRELVAPLYANGGRPSVDPVVFFKLQLVMFFEDLRSERQLVEVVAERLSLRWYLGYDLDELWHRRLRYGLRRPLLGDFGHLLRNHRVRDPEHPSRVFLHAGALLGSTYLP